MKPNLILNQNPNFEIGSVINAQSVTFQLKKKVEQNQGKIKGFQ